MNNDTLSLTISVDDGRLLVFLTDTKRYSSHGWASSDLQMIRNIATVVEPTSLQEIILPGSINNAIDISDAAVLLVQIQPELAFIPFEEFQAAGRLWCEKFALGCNLISTREPINRYEKSPNKQLRITFTNKIHQSEHISNFADHFTKSGITISNGEKSEIGISTLVASSANDAIKHIRDNNGFSPELCVWSSEPLLGSLGISLEEFNIISPACSIVAAHNFDSIEEMILTLTSLLNSINTGFSPIRAAQSINRRHVSSKWFLRLYNCDDSSLCSPPLITEVEVENRTITAMSIDVVASTKLMHRLGNERYSEVLAMLKERCIECIYDRGGSSGGRAGDDSTMAYFGLPNALENTASSALDTALKILSILPNLPGNPEVRIGIATGRVAVRSGTPYGEPIHLAARLQAFGEPGEITVDNASQWLARRDYEFKAHDEYTQFHGIDLPVLPIRLISHAKVKSNVIGGAGSSLFIGRDSELEELCQSWKNVIQGHQSIICIRGEAGIGKSRLAREFIKIALEDGARLLKIRGLSDYQGGVFYSLKESLRRGFGIQAGDSRLDVEERIKQVGSFPVVTIRNLAAVSDLLGITEIDLRTTGAGYSAKPSSELSVREHLFELLGEAIYAAGSDKPLILLVDDLQWIDPSAREALEHVIDVLRDISGFSLLVLCTERDDTAYQSLPGAKLMTLNRLPSQIACQFIRKFVGGNLSDDAVDRLVERADGVPLFLEESARLALDKPEGEPSQIFSVPESIDTLLMSRLDNLDKSGKYLVQIASVIGRDVQTELLQSVVNTLSDASRSIDFPAQMYALRGLGVLNELKAKGPNRLTFRHEMIRDVAYLSMWMRDRINVHAAVARVILEDRTNSFTHHPGMIAHHLTMSEQHEKAAIHWEDAARLAVDASANQEAIHSLRHALLSLEHMTENENTAKQEMRLQLMLAARLIARNGYGAEEVRTAYQRAELLVKQFGNKRDQLKVTLGLESVHVMRGELVKAEALATTAISIAGELPDLKFRTSMLIQARWALGNVKFHQGHSSEALSLMDKCVSDCSSLSYRSYAVQDPEIMCLCYGAWALWERGLPDTALRRAAQTVQLARSRKHRFSEAEALGFFASIAMFRGEFDIAIQHADLAIEICEQEKFVIWLAHARIIKGRCMARIEGETDAIAQMEQGYKDWTGTGAVITRAFYLTLIAETHLEANDPDTAYQRICEASEIITRTGEQYHLAEVLRIQGLIEYSNGDFCAGDELMKEAIEIANVQEKQSFVLRASTDMAKSFASRERYADAIRLIKMALYPIREGLTTSDPECASSHLQAWSALATSVENPSQQKLSDASNILDFQRRAND